MFHQKCSQLIANDRQFSCKKAAITKPFNAIEFKSSKNELFIKFVELFVSTSPIGILNQTFSLAWAVMYHVHIFTEAWLGGFLWWNAPFPSPLLVTSYSTLRKRWSHSTLEVCRDSAMNECPGRTVQTIRRPIT